MIDLSDKFDNMSEFAIYLEDFVEPFNSPIFNSAPAVIFNNYVESVKEEIPSAIAYHKDYGYFLLQCGQGPYIARSEKEIYIKHDE
jgi:hypothetical protein